MPDRIEIRGLRALGLIGVNPEEQERPQPFEVDFDVELDTSAAGASDSLEDTVDYGRLTILAQRVVSDEPHLLLGRLYERAGRLTDAIDEFKVAIWCRDTAAARIALGNALLANGDPAGARREAQRAIVLAPESTEARDLLRRAGG